jgi:hypothetical protein
MQEDTPQEQTSTVRWSSGQNEARRGGAEDSKGQSEPEVGEVFANDDSEGRRMVPTSLPYYFFVFFC